MQALIWLELMYAKHQAIAILRAPLRIAIWLPYSALILYFLYSRLAAHHGAYVSIAVTPKYATTIGGLYCAMLGATVGFAAGGRVALFRSSAEAVLFSNAGLRPLTMAVWLQLRKLATAWTRWLGGFVYLLAIAAPRNPKPIVLAYAFVAIALLLAVQMTIELPVFLLSRGILREPLRFAGWTIAAIGGLYGMAGIFGDHFLEPLVETVRVNPGVLVLAVLHGNVLATIVLAIVVAVLIGSILVLGDDALPELYAASRNTLSDRRRRRVSARPRFIATQPGDASRIPSGALALLWKDWVAFRRGRGVFRLWLIGCMCWAVCGAGVAYGVLQWKDPTPLYTLGATTLLLVLVLAPYSAAVGLSADLSKPLFWLSRSSLRERLTAWTFGRAWRGGVSLALAPLVAGLASANVALAITSVPVTVAMYWSLQALGVGLYAIFPNPIDGRGPVMVLRLFATALYVFPAAVVWALATALGTPFGSSAYVGALAFVVVMGIEGVLVIEFAAYRFREYGASLATASLAN
jgi:hypothetical protein